MNTTMNRELIHETTVSGGIPVRVFTIHGSGVYQAEWCLRDNWYRGYGKPTVAKAIAEAEERLAWDRIAERG